MVSESVSKMWIRVQGKARGGENTESRCKRDEPKDFEPARNPAVGGTMGP